MLLWITNAVKPILNRLFFQRLYVLTLSTVVDTRGVPLTETLPCSLQHKLLPNNHLGSSLQKLRENKK
uniref:Uncharacterized protein n=1 Tax=Papilio polytes TaxID=76194 RepID=I4DSC5_PAPPL|nr:unknown unsecreted protein [Papilio polytes]